MLEKTTKIWIAFKLKWKKEARASKSWWAIVRLRWQDTWKKEKEREWEWEWERRLQTKSYVLKQARAIISRIFIIISSLNETIVFLTGQPLAQTQVQKYVWHVKIGLCRKKCCKITIATPKRAGMYKKRFHFNASLTRRLCGLSWLFAMRKLAISRYVASAQPRIYTLIPLNFQLLCAFVAPLRPSVFIVFCYIATLKIPTSCSGGRQKNERQPQR